MNGLQVKNPVQSLEGEKITHSYNFDDLEIYRRCNFHTQRILYLYSSREKSQETRYHFHTENCFFSEFLVTNEILSEISILLGLWKKIQILQLRDAYIYKFCNIITQNELTYKMLPEDVLYTICIPGLNIVSNNDKAIENKSRKLNSSNGGQSLIHVNQPLQIEEEEKDINKIVNKYHSLPRKYQANFSYMVEELLKTR